MPEKDPNSWASLRAVLPILFGAGGGVIRYYYLIKSGRTFKFFEFVGDMLSSIFVGCVLYMLAEGLAQPTEISAVCAAIGGNMGARAFQIVESFFEKKLGEALQKPLFPSRIEQNRSVRFFFTTSKNGVFFAIKIV